MRILMFTGKGGTGKTTVAAATALRCSELGYKTIILSTDPAHSLSDSFDMRIGGKPTDVAPRLHGVEVDVAGEIEENWSEVVDYLSLLISRRVVDEILADEILNFPGVDEAFGLLKIRDCAISGEYDVIVVDCAPTGETFRFLAMPNLIGTFGRRGLKIQKYVMKGLRSFQPLIPMPLPGDEYFGKLKELLDMVEEANEAYQDAKVTSVRLVTNPEKMAILETERALTFLNVFGYAVDSVIVNKVIPDEVKDPYFEKWRELQAEHLKRIEATFSPLPVLKLKLFSSEVLGSGMLRDVATDLYGNVDPASVFCEEKPFTMKKVGDEFVVNLRLPFGKREDISLEREGEELIIQVGSKRRIVYLPTAAARMVVSEAKFRKGVLQILLKK